MAAKRADALVVSGVPPTLRLGGAVTPADLPALDAALRALRAAHHPFIRIDGRAVMEIDDRCADFLLAGLKALQDGGTPVALVGASMRLREALEDARHREPCRVAQAAWPVGPPVRRTTLELPCLPQSVALVRAHIAKIAAECPFSPVEQDDVVLAVGEAAANAVRHGLRFGAECLIRVCACAGPGGLCVAIADPGGGFDPESLGAPHAGGYHEGGMGIYLMRRVMDEVGYTFTAQGTTVRLVKYPRQGEGAPAPPAHA